MENEREMHFMESGTNAFRVDSFLKYNGLQIVISFLIIISVFFSLFFLAKGLSLSYNDARSHLDIGRRVVEGLNPGLAQLGSVWLPLPHFLMIFTIWSDLMWHWGLAGTLNSMVAYVGTGIYIWLILKKLKVSAFFQILGVSVFALNTNILYLQSTAMTELLLILTLTAATYELVCWSYDMNRYSLIKAAFWVMLSTLIRYEGWFLFLVSSFIVYFFTLLMKNKRAAEGILILYVTLAGVGILMWFVWNQLIFGDLFYFAFGPYSAHAQQEQLQAAGDLITKGNILQSVKIYSFALYYCIGILTLVAALLGAVLIFFDGSIPKRVKIAAVFLLASPIVFNVLALFMGHSVLFIEGISGKSWFNIRYGVMGIGAAAVFGAYLADRSRQLKYAILLVFLVAEVSSISNVLKSVTIADALYGSSGKDVSQVAGWLKDNIRDRQSRVLVSAASHDAVIFSSGLPMKQVIHEGTGPFWDAATKTPDRWAKFIVMRTNDVNDSTFRLLKDNKFAIEKYDLAYKGYFADIYELKRQYYPYLSTDFSLNAFGDYRIKKYHKNKISSLLFWRPDF